MADDRETAEKILLYTGGVGNVMQAAHCATRLRLVLRDPKKVREAELKDLPLVKGMIESGGQFQIILGTGIVNKVYKEFTALAGEGAGESLEKGAGDGTGNGAQIEAKGGNGIQRISRMFGDIFLPVIPVIVASGILMGVRSFLTGSGLMATDSNWYNIMAILIDTGFSFLPALICYSAAKKFGGSPILGFVLGLMVISSTLPAAGAVGKGNAEPMLIQLLGITFKLTGFQGSVLVAIVGGWLTAKIENMCRRFVPNVFDIILTPILTLGDLPVCYSVWCGSCDPCGRGRGGDFVFLLCQRQKVKGPGRLQQHCGMVWDHGTGNLWNYPALQRDLCAGLYRKRIRRPVFGFDASERHRYGSFGDPRLPAVPQRRCSGVYPGLPHISRHLICPHRGLY